ncbi:MAG: Transglycosylase domain protein [Frankiales bacterium]|nr:Transglycosylase domain protein [Frankiales bacterium]
MTRRTPLRRPAALVLQTAVLTALVGGASAWTMTTKTVTVSLDGRLREVRTHGGTVADALTAAGLSAGPHDLLAPSAEAPLDDGDRIALRRGRQLQLVVDGVRRSVWVTAASVDEALAQVGLRADSYVSASRSRSIPLTGLELDVRTPKSVAVVADGTVKVISSTGLTVRDALVQARVQLRPSDRLSLPRTTRLADLMTIRVTRISGRTVVESIAIPYATTSKPDATLYRGETKVLRPGSPGVLVRTYTITVVDGKPSAKKLVSEKRTANPVGRVVLVGTKARPAARRSSSTGTGADGLDWGALARCESGGNPRAVSSTGKYRGLYQFSISTWRGVGGAGDPIDASPAEQTYRAKILYNRSGRGSWPVCGRYL